MSVRNLVTGAELREKPQSPDTHLELVDGEIVEMSLATMLHGVIVGRVYGTTNGFFRRRDLSIVAASDAGFVLAGAR